MFVQDISSSYVHDVHLSPERVQFTMEATERGPPPSYEEAMDPSRNFTFFKYFI